MNHQTSTEARAYAAQQEQEQELYATSDRNTRQVGELWVASIWFTVGFVLAKLLGG